MKVPHYTRQFKKDLRLAQRRGKDIGVLKRIMTQLVEGHALSEKYKDHPLRGEFERYRECHIEPDWLLIYKSTPSEIHFVRAGTHSDLFE
ncbi:MAG: type II toxin-antitoxin system YafQ family toxin [Candidatus Omnitrophica bacterium]|nr:type II toxin-antitoxin system YafQ family toxin [Candidatus Omnitrophota bacterium]